MSHIEIKMERSPGVRNEDPESMVITRTNPISAWFRQLKETTNQGIRLAHPFMCSAMAALALSFIVQSDDFRKLKTLVQFILVFLLTVYCGFTAIITFWRLLGDPESFSMKNVHWTVRKLLNFGTCVFLIWICQITLMNKDFSLGVGMGVLAIQFHYFIHLGGYQVNRTIFQGLICCTAAVCIHYTHVFAVQCAIFGVGALLMNS